MASDFLLDDDNPFAPPTAGIGKRAVDVSEVDPEAERVRRKYIGREKSIKAIGLLDYVVAGFFGLGSIALAGLLVYSAATGRPPGAGQANATAPWLVLLGVLAVYSAITLIFGFLGFGLRRLQAWSRWSMLGLASLALAATLVGGSTAFVLGNPDGRSIPIVLYGLFQAFLVYLLATPRAGVVFSREYKAIIARTSHVKNRTSTATKVVAVALIAAIICGAIYLTYFRP